MARLNMKKTVFALSAAAMAVTGLAGTAYAQRDPAYAAARASGAVGEKMDGFLGVVGSGSAATQAIVKDINIKRRANYAQRASSQNATLEEYAFTQGCILIARTTAGEKYQAPDGTWQTRTSAAPQRDSRCP